MKETPYPIFQIGFNKCGTTSFHKFFLENGYQSIHWDNGHIAKTLKRNLENSALADKNYQRYQKPLFSYNENSFFCDMEDAEHLNFGFFYYKKLFQHYKNAKFILNVRDKDAWIKSRLRHPHTQTIRHKEDGYSLGRYAKDQMFRYGDLLNCRLKPKHLIEIWSLQWDYHIQDCKDFFSDKDEKLLIFNIQKDSPEKIVNFFQDMDLSVVHWGHMKNRLEQKRK